MTTVQKPDMAGFFYPEDAEKLRSDLLAFLEAARADPDHAPKAIVAPHAGYEYSGPIAGSAYAQIRAKAGEISRVLLLGPSHRVLFSGLAYSSADAFETPLGSVHVDRTAFAALRGMRQVRQFDAPFQREHCLEVQLPFLQTVLRDFSIVPFVVGDAEPDEVAEVLETLWGEDETLIVISSDLSHYLDYSSARAIDARTSRAIEALRPKDIAHEQACGRTPLAGLLRMAERHGLRARTLDLRNSGDTAGPRDQVVGYGAYAFS